MKTPNNNHKKKPVLKQKPALKLEYSFSRTNRKWAFVAPQFTLLASCQGGRETAAKAVPVILGALKRTKSKGLDGMARHALKVIGVN